jgi:VRR-NUC domain
MSLTPEQIDHINIVNWFHYEFPELADDLHHFANERKCSINEGRKLKRMGVKKGVLDFFLAIPLNGKAGLWVELKVGKGRLTPEQIQFIERKISRGYEAIAVWGEDAAKAVILTYLNRAVKNE